VFWIISVYFNIRNTLPKSGTFLLGHPVYIYSQKWTHVKGHIKKHNNNTPYNKDKLNYTINILLIRSLRPDRGNHGAQKYLGEKPITGLDTTHTYTQKSTVSRKSNVSYSHCKHTNTTDHTTPLPPPKKKHTHTQPDSSNKKPTRNDHKEITP